MSDISNEESDGRGRYVLNIEGHEAELVYIISAGTMRIAHTGVPTELGGRGIGGRLVQHAVGEARKRGLKVDPACSFAAREFSKHTEYADVRR